MFECRAAGRNQAILDVDRILLHGTVLSVSGSFIRVAAVYFNPGFARRDLGSEILAATPPLSKKEKTQAIAFVIPLFAVVVLVPLLSGLMLEAPAGGQPSLLVLFLQIFGVLFVFSLADSLVLDCLIYGTITPKFVIIPGTERLAGYKNHEHQVQAHVRGTASQALLALLLACSVFAIR